MTCSWITAACALLIALWTAPQLLATGVVGVGGSPLFEVLYLFPALIGVPVCLLAAAVAATLLVRGMVTTTARRLLAWGQILTVTLLALCVVALATPRATGWELVLMPGALQIGQVVVAAGLILLVRDGRRGG